MGERTSHAPGTFSWVDLATSEAAGAKSFYAQLFGWEAEDMPAEGGTYTIFRLGGKDVAACFEQGNGAAGEGVPPHWNSYVTVSDVDAAMTKSSELGGSVVMDAIDVENVGRMGVIADPTGAPVALWEPRGHIGAGLVNAPGALCWNDLGTTDVDKAGAFFGELLGWTYETPPDNPMQYTTVRNGEVQNGSIHRQTEQESGVPPNWLAYFATDDLASSAGKVRDLGGQVVVPPMEVPAGTIAVATDPQGAAFGLFEGELDA